MSTSPQNNGSARRRDAVRFGKPETGWRQRLYTVIFEADTRAGRRFDIVLISAVLLSVAVVIIDSVGSINARHEQLFDLLEWTFSILFAVEYAARLACVRRPLRYALSFFGVIDLLSFLPAWIALFLPEAQSLMDVRILRLLRMFRVLKLGEYVAEYGTLARALASSRRKILIFLSVVMMVVLVLGTLMYVIEGPQHGFTSIPAAVYWAIVTMTTVGYGDITPTSDLGRFVASIMMLLGWGILAVPTGIVTSELTAQRVSRPPTTRTCHECLSEGHEASAQFCKDCGAPLPPYMSDP